MIRSIIEKINDYCTKKTILSHPTVRNKNNGRSSSSFSDGGIMLLGGGIMLLDGGIMLLDGGIMLLDGFI